jgi:hypothetical protein
MWIIPKQLHALSGAPDTEAFLLDLNEQSQACEQSLLARSKPSPARTWLLKWKRDSWMQHLFGRILKLSHVKPFEIAWTSLWQGIHANPSPQPESDLAPKTQDTCGPTLPDQLELFAPECASLRMSKDISASDSERSLESWNQLVTRRRGEYSLRVKSALLIKEKGCSSWPTAATRDYKGESGSGRQERKGNPADTLPNAVAQWPTASARDWRDNPGIEKTTRKDGKSRVDQLARRVYAEQTWPTLCASESHAGTPDGKMQWMLTQAAISNCATRDQYGKKLYGQQSANAHAENTDALANADAPSFALDAEENTPSVDATAQPKTGLNTSGETEFFTDDQSKHGPPAPVNNNTGGSRQGLWATPSGYMNTNPAEEDRNSMNLGMQAKQWATPNNFCFQPPENTEQWTKRAEYQQTEKGVNLHKPIQSQVLHENEKVIGPMPPSAAKLNPRWVETLMGLPVGWVMPSCASPVTIAPTNFDCSETESCQPPPSEPSEP